MNRYITFTEESQKEINKVFDLAEKVYGGTYDEVRILAGNFAGYGRHAAHYFPDSKIIEFPINETFDTVIITQGGYEIKNLDIFKGILLHELGHHYAETALSVGDELKAGYSTHTTAKWCYICAMGWNYFDRNLHISPATLAKGIRHKVDGLAKEMAAFDPYNPPYEILKQIPSDDGYTKVCHYCKKTYVSKRSDSKFCSAKCRVSFNRKKKK